MFLNEFFNFRYINFFQFLILFIASRNGHHEVIKELLRNKAKIEAIDHNGCTPLLCGNFLNELFIFKHT